ncbi:hypothetical protein BDB01DRAFT_812414 [Pilobolus umbonatus]|nr:hypothetical protein BDB01DRAFT_812414 [Pilobolus umbonatus]
MGIIHYTRFIYMYIYLCVCVGIEYKHLYSPISSYLFCLLFKARRRSLTRYF